MILLTGASGFIGKRLLKNLQAKFGFDNVIAMTSEPILEGRFVLHQNYDFSSSFINENSLERIEIIIHAGAYTPKSGGDVNNWKQCNSNIITTDKLYSLNLPNLKKLIFLSTLDVYSTTDEKISETTAVDPSSLYGSSKLYCERLTTAFSHKNNIVSQILRIGHTYGPGEEAYQKVIPNTMKNLLMGLQPQIWGMGEELRSFIFIDDVISAIINSLAYDNFLGEINVVSENSYTIKNLIQKIINISDYKKEIEFINKDFKGKSLSFDNQKVKRLLLDKETNLEVGLKQEYNYLKKLYE